MTQIAYDFDATQYAPRQTLGSHPVGKFPASITGVEGKPAKDGAGGNGYIAVTFTTQAGSIIKRYNVWNTNQQAVDIAHGELSALSHATRVFRWSLRDGGKALIGAQCQIEVGPQIDKLTGQPNAQGYVEVKKVFDAQGNDPTQPLNQQPQQQLSSQGPPNMTPQQYAPQSQQPGYTPSQGQQSPYPVDNVPMPGSAGQQQPFGQPPATPVPGQGFPQPGGGAPNPWGGQPQPAQQQGAPNWQQQPQGGAPAWSQPRQ